jgi:7-cyano-7-deazaguanine synthase in queuosine biosynthesis
MIQLNLGPDNHCFEFNINNYNKDLALLFSGGADSTLLLYLLLHELGNTDKTLNCYVIDRYNKPIDRAFKVFNLVTNKLNVNAELKVLSIPKVEQHREVGVGASLLANKHDMIFSGTNKYPSDTSIRPRYIFKHFAETTKFKLPLMNLEKPHVIDAFYQLGIDNILSQTHSCGLQLETPCVTKCFNCRERTWAFKILNRVLDSGI